jgi:hypothetical protein
MIANTIKKPENIANVATKRFSKCVETWGFPIRIKCFYDKGMTNEIICNEMEDVEYAKQAFMREYY